MITTSPCELVKCGIMNKFDDKSLWIVMKRLICFSREVKKALQLIVDLNREVWAQTSVLLPPPSG